MFYSPDIFSAIDNEARGKAAEFASLFRFPTDDSRLTLSEISKPGPKTLGRISRDLLPDEPIVDPETGKMLLIKDSDRAFVCSYCGKECKTKGQRRRCEAIHAGGPLRYRCTFCEKTFYEKSDLVRHIRSHTGESPYQCTECGRSFKTIENLKQHMVNHTGETPHECIRCKQKFKFYSTRNNHKCPANV